MTYPSLLDMIIAFPIVMFTIKLGMRIVEPEGGGSESFVRMKENVKKLYVMSYLMAVLPIVYLLYRQFSGNPVCWSSYGLLCS